MRIPFITVVRDGQIDYIRQTSDEVKLIDFWAYINGVYYGVEWSQKEIELIATAGKFKDGDLCIAITWIEVTV